MNKYQYKVQGVDYEVEIEDVEGNIAKVNVNGIPFEVEMQRPINAAKHPNIVKPKVAAPVAPAATAAPAAPAAPQQKQPAASASGNSVKAPLPGTITAVQVKVGDTVNVGDVVVVEFVEQRQAHQRVSIAVAVGQYTAIVLVLIIFAGV